MGYKDILVQIDEATPPGRCEIAVELASRCGGRVTGLYLRTDLVAELVRVDPVEVSVLVDSIQRFRDHNQREDGKAAAAAAMLEQIALASKVDCEFRTICGDTPRDMIIEARHADLVVVGPWDPLHKGQAFAVDIALGAGVPALIVPAKVDHPRVGERVLVAWNGSRESSSALRNALPILTRDAILEVRSAQQKHDRTDAAALISYLERHACRLNFKGVDDEGQSIPKWLISEALEAGCDVIVMGVYGHTRQRDFVLSEVSRRMLHSSPLPLLISY
jgi:nucleotide-binding universal stress UspA family protein